ncbi:Small glutamine-rich tetratricopeptide repeat-containing protein 2 [Coemansia sp. RSA 2711]|nr:Small glutamine-rich tetratricopeptide repeat-containing protein 2 [Coemansia sp. RSA 2711]
MQSSEENNCRRLAMGIVEYLDKAVADGLVTSDGAESLEIAKQCITDAFELDLENQDQVKELSLKPFSLDKVFDVYMATQAKLGANDKASAATTTATTGAAAAVPSDEDRRRADAYKAEGNSFVTQRDYKSAIDAYTKAIELVGDTAVYYGNRAAAYSQSGEHEKAVADAKQALDIDSAYSKGYSRLGLAHFGLGQYQEAADAYEKGLELDPTNKVMLASLESARSKLAAASPAERAAASPTDTQSASGSGAGGFDLGSLMNNPALMGMAQNMMANGGLERLMNNPELMNMARNFGGGGSGGSTGGDSAGGDSTGGGSNPLASLMNNPALMNMARQFMSGGNNNSGNSSGGQQ